GVIHRKQARHHLNDDNLRAKSIPQRGKLRADWAATNNEYALRQRLKFQGLRTCDDALAIGLQSRQLRRRATRSNNDRSRAHFFLTTVNQTRRNNARSAFDHFNPMTLE